MEKENRKEGEGQEEVEDEMKMDKFYSLLRSFRERRDRRRKELEEELQKKKKTTCSWVPSFEWEDFTTEIEFRRPLPNFPTRPRVHTDKANKEQHRHDHDLDLKLSL